MAIIDVTTDTYWDQITGKTAAGGDTYAIANGAKLIMRTDTRQCAYPQSDFGKFTIDQYTGGELRIDGTGVRLIPYNSGSGNVPAVGATITQGGVSAYMLGVWPAVNVAPTAEGAAMPASGFIKVIEKSGGDFSSGALSGIGASATGADIVGWILVLARNLQSSTASGGAAKLVVDGDWFDVGVTSGVRNQTLNCPYLSGSLPVSGVWIETSPGSGSYDHYPNVSQTVSASTPTSAERGKVVWVSAAGVVRIGHNGANNVGYLPPAGCKVRIPNVILLTANSAGAIESIYNGVSSNEFIYYGRAEIAHCMTTWYVYAQKSAVIAESAFAHKLFLNSSAVVTDTIVGYGAGNLSSNPFNYVFTMYGNVNDRVPITVDKLTVMQVYATGYSALFSNCYGTVNRLTCINTTVPSVNDRISINMTSTLDLEITNPTLIGGCIMFNVEQRDCKIIVTNIKFAYSFSGTTGATYALSVIKSSSYYLASAEKIVLDGVSFLEANTHPYPSIINTFNAKNLHIRNLGTPSNHMTAGSANAMTHAITSFAFGWLGLSKVQRIYMDGLSALFAITSTECTEAIFQNCYGDYADAIVPRGNNTIYRSIGAAIDKTATTSLDNYFHSFFTSTTAGELLLAMSEKSKVDCYTIEAGAPVFSGNGTVRLGAVGQSIVWTMPWYAKGFTAFQNASPVLTGGTAGNFTLEYKIDRNDGNGFSVAWTTLNGANLSAESIDPVSGFKLQIRIACAIANTEDLSFVGIPMTTTATDQLALYNLEEAVLSLENLVVGSSYLVTKASDGSLLASGTAASTTEDLIIPYEGVDFDVIVKVRKGSAPFYRPYDTVVTINGASVIQYINQQPD